MRVLTLKPCQGTAIGAKINWAFYLCSQVLFVPLATLLLIFILMLVYPRRTNGIMKFYLQSPTLPSLKILLEKLLKFWSLGHIFLFTQSTVIYKYFSQSNKNFIL